MKGGTQRTGRSREIANAFPEGRGRIPDGPLIAASVAALFKGGDRARSLIGGWSADDRGQPIYRHVQGDGDQIVVSVDLCDAPPEGSGADGQWALVEGISPLTIDVLFAVLAQSCVKVPDGPPLVRLDPAQVSARAILGYKALGQWGAEGAALRRRIDSEITRLNSLRFIIHRWRGEGQMSKGSSAGGATDKRYRLFDVFESRVARTARTTFADRSEIVWTIRLGRCSCVVNDHCEELRFVSVPQLLLRLDHRENRGSAVLAKKIGLLVSVLQGGPGHTGSLQWQVSELLENIGELPRPDARGDRWGARMRDRLARALLLLQEDGVVGSLSWPVGSETDSNDRNKGWVAAWLKSSVLIDRPFAAAADRGASLVHPPAMQRAGKSAAGLLELHRGSVIRAMRTERKISQYRLACELGISAAYLSQIENERRMVSRALLGRIASWASESREGKCSQSEKPAAVASLERASGAWTKKIGRRSRYTVGGMILQATVPCRPAGKDEQE